MFPDIRHVSFLSIIFQPCLKYCCFYISVFSKLDHEKNLSSFVKPIISSKLKPKASNIWSKVDCK